MRTSCSNLSKLLIMMLKKQSAASSILMRLIKLHANLRIHPLHVMFPVKVYSRLFSKFLKAQ
ncbi:hypothetical protein D3C72_2548630 [compost metagenome]